MYKDKDKQREAQRNWVRQKRIDKKGSTTVVMGSFQDAFDNAVKEVKSKPKRGKDIKCFADLPTDVQQTIDSMSTVAGKIDQTIKANRTAIAVNYQHTFGAGAYYPHGAVCTGIVTGKPFLTMHNNSHEDVVGKNPENVRRPRAERGR